MKKITSLTPEQIATVPQFRDKWWRIATDTSRMDRDKVMELYAGAYKAKGLKAPKKENVHFFESPNALARAIRRRWKEIGEDDKQSLMWSFGRMDAYFLSYLDFFHHHFGVGKELIPLLLFEMEVGHFIACDTDLWISEQPSVIKLKGDLLHCDGGPVREYADGEGKIYRLNGVLVPEWLAVEPAESIHGSRISEIDNAEVRREFVRKLGHEKLCRDLGAKVVDHLDKVNGGPYELLDVVIAGGNRKYLKMINPSIGVYHIEPVSPDCATVDDALEFRMPAALRDIQVADDGEDWYLQGDVPIWREGMKKRKKYPSKIS